MRKITLLLCFLALSQPCFAKKTTLRKQAELILKSNCADCHSHQTQFPWYAQLPIVHDLINSDIERGLSSLNIEEEIIQVRQDKDIAQDIVRRLETVISNNAMPPIQYRVMHWDSKLDSNEKTILIRWLGQLKNSVIEPITPITTLDQGKVLLGEKLFHDTRLSRDNSISCASCHDLKKGGTDQKQFSTGIDHAKGRINSPTVYNAFLNHKQFWDGRAENLEAQAHGPVHNPKEMGSNWDEVLTKLKEDPELIQEILKVYQLKKPEEISGDHLANSIAEFEMSLSTPNSRFDQYLHGNKGILSASEKQGFALFKKHNCSSCHLGAGLGGTSFQKMGLKKDYFNDRAQGQNHLNKLAISKEDYGRMNKTKKDNDKYKFKVPLLRNLSLTYPYLHDGNAKTIEEAVRIMLEYQVGISKTNPREVQLISAFLRTLTDEDLLHPPKENINHDPE